MEILGSKTLKPSQIVQEETQLTLSSLHSHNSPSSSLFISFFSLHLFLFFMFVFQTFSFIIYLPFQLLNAFSRTISFLSPLLLPLLFFLPSPLFPLLHSFLWKNHLTCINFSLLHTTEVLHISKSPTAIIGGHLAPEKSSSVS